MSSNPRITWFTGWKLPNGRHGYVWLFDSRSKSVGASLCRKWINSVPVT